MRENNDPFTLVANKLTRLYAYIKNAYIRKSENKKSIYKVTETYRNSAGEYVIVAKIIDSPRGLFKMSVYGLIKRRDLLSGFDTDDMITIIGLASTAKEATVIQKKPTTYKFYALLAMLFSAALITANIASSKLISIFGYTMTGGALVYPVAYILGDIITEVYGYKRTRQLIWGAISCNLFIVFFITLAIAAPPSPYWHNQKEYALILGAVPRIIAASLMAYWAGEFANSYIIAKMKIAFNGQRLWMRIVSASIVGITVDALTFVSIAFSGILPIDQIFLLAAKVYIFNVGCEILSIPLSMWLIGKIKANEHLDIFDINTNFTPFSLNVEYSDINNRMTSQGEPDDNENSGSEDHYHPGKLAK